MVKRLFDLSIVIPAKNEALRIGPTLHEYTRFLVQRKINSEIIVVVNQTTDNTKQVVQEYQRKFPWIKLISDAKAQGKGEAVARGFKVARGNLIGFIDADGATSPYQFYRLYSRLATHPKLDGVIASRYCVGAKVYPKQPWLRRAWSRGYNLAVRLLFGLNYSDTQCGSKIFRFPLAKILAESLVVGGWGFDVNMLLVARQREFCLEEIAIHWQAKPGSSLKTWPAIYQVPLELVKLLLLR